LGYKKAGSAFPAQGGSGRISEAPKYRRERVSLVFCWLYFIRSRVTGRAAVITDQRAILSANPRWHSILDTMEFGQNDIFGRIREFCVRPNDCALTCFQQRPKVSLQVATGVPEGTESGALPKTAECVVASFFN
jgi:hypothetical protein